MALHVNLAVFTQRGSENVEPGCWFHNFNVMNLVTNLENAVLRAR